MNNQTKNKAKIVLDKLGRIDLSYLIVAVDFDGTCVTHQFPEIGDDVPWAEEVLKALDKAGAKIILWTMRSNQSSVANDPSGKAIARHYLQQAVDWFTYRGISLYGINQNPQQLEWTESPKAYAHLYIDDAAVGCPLIESDHSRPYVDWLTLTVSLIKRLGMRHW